MDWVAIITMIIESIMQCREQRSRESVKRDVSSPGLRQWLALRVSLRRSGFSFPEINEALRGCHDEISRCEKEGCWEECCDDLLDQAEAKAKDQGVQLAS